MPEFSSLSSEQQEKISEPFENTIDTIERQKLIAVIRDTLRCFEETEYPKLLAQMSDEGQRGSSEKEVDREKKTVTGNYETIKNQKSKIKNLRSISVAFDKAWLADEADVERYLKAMRDALLEEIRQGKKIQI